MRLHGHRSHAGASLSGAASKTDDELLILWFHSLCWKRPLIRLPLGRQSRDHGPREVRRILAQESGDTSPTAHRDSSSCAFCESQ
jgi:hypothetical protein